MFNEHTHCAWTRVGRRGNSGGHGTASLTCGSLYSGGGTQPGLVSWRRNESRELGALQQIQSLVSRRKSRDMLSWVSEVAVYTGRQLGFSRPQIRMTTISSRSAPNDAPSRRKLWPGRSGEPYGQKGPGCLLQRAPHPRTSAGPEGRGLLGGAGSGRWGFRGQGQGRGSWGWGSQAGVQAHLVGQTSQQVEHEVAHPLQELLQRLKRVHVQDELLRLEVDHDLVNVWEGTGSQGRPETHMCAHQHAPTVSWSRPPQADTNVVNKQMRDRPA